MIIASVIAERLKKAAEEIIRPAQKGVIDIMTVL
jgi:hypothetical protein